MPFQSTVNYQPGAAVPGDFASNNPRANVLAGPSGLVAGTGGVTVAAFGWVDTTAETTVLNSGTGAPQGFVARPDNTALITSYLAETGAVIPAGMGVTLYNSGDFWAITGTAATVGQKVFASNTTGAIETGAAGAVITGFTETNFYVASIAAVNGLVKISSRFI